MSILPPEPKWEAPCEDPLSLWCLVLPTRPRHLEEESISMGPWVTSTSQNLFVGLNAISWDDCYPGCGLNQGTNSSLSFINSSFTCGSLQDPYVQWCLLLKMAAFHQTINPAIWQPNVLFLWWSQMCCLITCSSCFYVQIPENSLWILWVLPSASGTGGLPRLMFLAASLRCTGLPQFGGIQGHVQQQDATCLDWKEGSPRISMIWFDRWHGLAFFSQLVRVWHLCL